MKKIIFYIGILVICILLVGCKQKSTDENPIPTEKVVTETTPTTRPTDVIEPTTVEVSPTSIPPTNSANYTIEDYFPFLQDTETFFEGEGNEYASYQTYTDFVDESNKRVQVRTNNGGTVTVQVLEIKNGKLSIILTKEECYYRDNFLDSFANEDKSEILLMEPLVVGTKWKLPDGRNRYISDVGVEINTPLGTFQALEVTTEEIEATTREYYVVDMGLVKRMFTSQDMLVTSTLRERNSNVPFSQLITVYYPNTEEKIVKEQKTLSFETNDITRTIFQEAITDKVKEGYLTLAGPNTLINSMYLGEDNIAYIDFSNNFVSEMNTGAAFENLILQCIANTIGNYYGVDEVYITVEQKPYESGHIMFKKGETIKVSE